MSWRKKVAFAPGSGGNSGTQHLIPFMKKKYDVIVIGSGREKIRSNQKNLICSSWIAYPDKVRKEILKQVNGPIHGFCSGIGTGGTITGIGEVLKEHNPDMTIWAVEPENAAILSGGSIGTHVQMGIGDGIIPPILNQNIYDDVCIIKDEEALQVSKDLAAKEGIMCGISSGTNVAAAIKLAKKLGKGKRVVTILPDTAERYFSTPLFE